jgi:hemolysin activation/secretion protein
MSWSFRQSATQLYAALDMGEVQGPNAEGLPNRFMAGGAIGVRFQTKKFQLDCFVGRPFRIPSTVRTGSTAAGFSLNYSL